MCWLGFNKCNGKISKRNEESSSINKVDSKESFQIEFLAALDALEVMGVSESVNGS